MLPIFMVYIVISLAFGFIGVANANTDKFNYSIVIALLMLMISPIVSHGLMVADCFNSKGKREKGRGIKMKKILTVVLILVCAWVIISYANILCTNLSTHDMASWNIMNVIEKTLDR